MEQAFKSNSDPLTSGYPDSQQPRVSQAEYMRSYMQRGMEENQLRWNNLKEEWNNAEFFQHSQGSSVRRPHRDIGYRISLRFVQVVVTVIVLSTMLHVIPDDYRFYNRERFYLNQLEEEKMKKQNEK